MMDCKKCLHFPVCRDFYNEIPTEAEKLEFLTSDCRFFVDDDKMVQFDINDVVYRADGNEWDREINNYRNYIVGKYVVRSISISCNSKGEWKKSYRAQQEINGRIISYGFNFRDDNVGSKVFINYEDAEKHCLELAHNNRGHREYIR